MGFRRTLGSVSLLLICVAAVNNADAAADRPAALAKRAVVISVDGLRPDLLIRAETPNIRALMNAGSFTMFARTTDVAVTLPSHTSMLTGVVPERHGINFNNDGPEETIYPTVPTLFELAKRVGYTTGIASGKSKFASLARPGTVDVVRIPARATGYKDEQVAANAAEIIRNEAVDFLLIHFPGNDSAGHRHGWGTDEQLAALENVDRAIGVVLEALRDAEQFDETLIILTADHGGQGKTHGKDDERSRLIPWIAVGPNIRKNVDLTRFSELKVRTEDTFATICWYLDIPIEGKVVGKPVKLIRQDLELMSSTPAATTAPTPNQTTATTLPAADKATALHAR